MVTRYPHRDTPRPIRIAYWSAFSAVLIIDVVIIGTLHINPTFGALGVLIAWVAALAAASLVARRTNGDASGG
jgi:hypothetical protein